MTSNRVSISAFIFGLLFAVGLGISGMTQPEKVIGFLDVAGAWDPSLAFVMGGAVLVYFFAFRRVQSLRTPRFAETFSLPELTQIDVRLVSGAVLFGVGWGLAGFCPGPAITSLASASLEVIIFVGAMLVGMFLFRLMPRR